MEANPQIRDSLYILSGLGFILEPMILMSDIDFSYVLTTYFGMTNGLNYFAKNFLTGTVEMIEDFE